MNLALLLTSNRGAARVNLAPPSATVTALDVAVGRGDLPGLTCLDLGRTSGPRQQPRRTDRRRVNLRDSQRLCGIAAHAGNEAAASLDAIPHTDTRLPDESDMATTAETPQLP